MGSVRARVFIFLSLFLAGFAWGDGDGKRPSQDGAKPSALQNRPLGGSVKAGKSYEAVLRGSRTKEQYVLLAQGNQSRDLRNIQRSVDAVKAAHLSTHSIPDDVEIARIQQQISQILKANEKLKTQHQEQLEQIKKITEQAEIHRRMLQEIEKRRKDAASLTPSDVDEILRQEKLRLIRNETEKNKAFLATLAEEEEEADLYHS